MNSSLGLAGKAGAFNKSEPALPLMFPSADLECPCSCGINLALVANSWSARSLPTGRTPSGNANHATNPGDGADPAPSLNATPVAAIASARVFHRTRGDFQHAFDRQAGPAHDFVAQFDARFQVCHAIV